MNENKLDIVFLGLTITSTWGNGHATTYRGLLKELNRLGHRVTFLERDVPWYSSQREFEHIPYARVRLYRNLEELRESYRGLVHNADVVIVGSYVPDGISVGNWVIDTGKGIRAFYDIDTPVTLSTLAAGSCFYLSKSLCAEYDLYLSFTGGPTLRFIEKQLGSPCARALYCSVDPELYYPEPTERQWDLAYLGTYAADRQPSLQKLLVNVARRETGLKFAVAGPQYPKAIVWPSNVERIEHLPASEHRQFYNAQQFTLNLTRRDMVRAGYSPSVRLFEAAACGTPIISDVWPGLETIFRPKIEILTARSTHDVSANLRLSTDQRDEIGFKARNRVLRHHTAAIRALELVTYVNATFDRLARSKGEERVVFQAREVTATL